MVRREVPRPGTSRPPRGTIHASYGDHEALIEIETLAVYRGDLPRRAMALVLEWAMLHRQELRHDWQLVTTGQTPDGVEPLE